MVIVYEGGTPQGRRQHQRLASALDPQGYEVIPIAAPHPRRTGQALPVAVLGAPAKTGHIAIFDRSWYGQGDGGASGGLCSGGR